MIKSTKLAFFLIIFIFLAFFSTIKMMGWVNQVLARGVRSSNILGSGETFFEYKGHFYVVTKEELFQYALFECIAGFSVAASIFLGTLLSKEKTEDRKWTFLFLGVFIFFAFVRFFSLTFP